jgi:hypothetical protein
MTLRYSRLSVGCVDCTTSVTGFTEPAAAAGDGMLV